jgi:transcription factor SPT20
MNSARIAPEADTSPAVEPPPQGKEIPKPTHQDLVTELSQVPSKEYILKKYVGNPPSLVVHLHPSHFRFDSQEGMFQYKSPMGSIFLGHVRSRTIPHELLELFNQGDVPFYEGCLIVQVHDHKSTAQSQEETRPASPGSKTVPSSIHNYNPYITPSPYVPYPRENLPSAGQNGKHRASPTQAKTSEERDKESMPAPSAPSDGQRNNKPPPPKPKITTVVLFPTPQSLQKDLLIEAMTPRGASDIRPDGVPPTLAAVPPTPTPTASSMQPPAKRQKREQMELDGTNISAAEGQILLATMPPLDLTPARNAAEMIRKLDSQAHPAHSEKPPPPKKRKRTEAEMEADQAIAADQQRYMLTMDERLSSTVAGAQGSANGSDGDGQGGTAWEPRFEPFTFLADARRAALEKAERESREQKEKVEQERQRQAEVAQQKAIAEAQAVQQRAVEQARQLEDQQVAARQRHVQQQALRARAQAQAQAQAQQQAQQQANAQAQAQAQAQEQAQTQAQMQAQARAQAQAHAQAQQNNNLGHGHPMQNGGMPNGLANGMPASMAGQAQARFHQVSQPPVSSPVVRQNTPQNMSSPMVGNVSMQHSTSSMGGSPARPSSVVQNHQPMSVPMTASMSARGSQQSHPAGTPRMPNATPNMPHSTPISRPQVIQTPRMTQASPPPGMLTPGQQLGQAHLMMNAQGLNPQLHNQQLMAAQMAQQQQRVLQQQQIQQALQNGIVPGTPNQPMTPQQLAHQQRLLQQQMMQMQQRGMMTPQQQQAAAQYTQTLQNMSNNMQQQQMHGGQMQNHMQRQMGAPGQGMMNGNGVNNPVAQLAMMRQMEQIRQQHQQAQLQQQQQQHAQQQQQQQQHQQMGQQPQMQPQLQQYPPVVHNQIKIQQNALWATNLPKLIAQHGGREHVPPQALEELKQKCHAMARNNVIQLFNNQNRMNQIAMMQQQQQRQQQQQAQGMQGMMPQDM